MIKKATPKPRVARAKAAPDVPLRLDLGCGPNKRDGFFGVDAIKFDKVDMVLDLGDPGFPWPWKDNSVEEVHCAHFIEHLTWPQRIWFFNQLYRVMKPGAKCTLIWPHWCSARFYGDPTHKEPMSEMALLYLNAEWRKGNAPHVGYTCNFSPTWGYALHPELVTRPTDYQQHALAFYKEAAQDIHATLTKPE